MNLLNVFFSNKRIWNFKKGEEKIGLWIPLLCPYLIFIQLYKNFEKKIGFYMNRLNDFFSNKQKKARRR